MSASSKEMLADLLQQMSRLQAVMAKLRCARTETDTDLFQELESAGVRTAIYGGRLPAIRGTLNEKNSESALVSEPDTSSQSPPLLIRIDLCA